MSAFLDEGLEGIYIEGQSEACSGILNLNFHLQEEITILASL